MKRKVLGTRVMILGVVLIAAAFGLVAYNLIAQRHAGKAAHDALDVLTAAVTPVPELGDGSKEIPLYEIDPNVSMPELTVNGISYIGYLNIPALKLELPVITRTTNYDLTIAPCRFSGTAYLEDLVIGAHNYSTHFGRLKELRYGDEITFTDMDGNVFHYAVDNIETLTPDQDEVLRESEYPLSLYTCTIGGRTRLTVRCVAAQ